MSVRKPGEYPDRIASLLAKKRLPSLGISSPNEEVGDIFKGLKVSDLFAPETVLVEPMGAVCQAALGYYHDFIGKVEEICETVPNSSADYLRGMVARRQLNWSRSRTWFEKVGEHPISVALNAQVRKLAMSGFPHRTTDFLVTQEKWDPIALNTLCKQCLDGQSPAEELCREILYLEWGHLFDYSFRQALGR